MSYGDVWDVVSHRNSGVTIAYAAGDDLTDGEGEEYVARLRATGVPAQMSRCDGMNHRLFFWRDVDDKADATTTESCAWLRELFKDS